MLEKVSILIKRLVVDWVGRLTVSGCRERRARLQAESWWGGWVLSGMKEIWWGGGSEAQGRAGAGLLVFHLS